MAHLATRILVKQLRDGAADSIILQGSREALGVDANGERRHACQAAIVLHPLRRALAMHSSNDGPIGCIRQAYPRAAHPRGVAVQQDSSLLSASLPHSDATSQAIQGQYADAGQSAGAHSLK
jgi:hypothetical protein